MNAPQQAAGWQPVAEPLRPTTARWLNRRRRGQDARGEWADRWSKVLAHNGGYDQFRYGTHTETDWSGAGPFQKAIICSPWSGVIAVDVDDEALFKATRTGQLIGREHAISTRGGGFHVLLDARAVPPGAWPVAQRPIAGADIKSCGFIPMPGSDHYSGERYEPVPGAKVVPLTAELLAAITADQAEAAQAGTSSGAESGNGAGGGHDGELAAQVLGWVRQGLGKEETFARWSQVAIPRDPDWPFTRDDFERHYRTATAKAAKTAAPEPQISPDTTAWAMSTTAPAQAAGTVAVVPPPAAPVAVAPPRIDCGGGHGPETIRAVQDALNARAVPGTYAVDGRVAVLEEAPGQAVTPDGSRPLPVMVAQAGPADLASLLARYTYTVRWVRDGKDKMKPQEFTPAASALAAALAPRSWPGLRPLNGIIGAPVLRPDGTLLQEPRYDEATGLYLASRVDPGGPVRDRPSADAVAWAKNLLLDQVLRDFPWCGPADKANYLAMLVTQVLRRYLRGAPVPFFPVSATSPSSGKTLLTAIPGVLFGQVKLVWTGDDEELRKALTTVMSDQAGVIGFDNLPEGTVIRSSVLSKLLTDRTWGDRLLGGNALARFANDRLWTATGNNLRIGGDMRTRSVLVSIDPRMPHPEQRSGFAIPDLESWIEEPASQRQLLGALLVMVASWAAAGCPEADVVPMRQFTRWARACGGFLSYHGVPGFLANAGELESRDDDSADWTQFLARWQDILGGGWVRSEQVCDTAPDPRWGGSYPAGKGGEPLSAKSLGRRLTGMTGRYHGTFVLNGQRDPHTKTWWWKVAIWQPQN